jgi:hypothetical protein
MEFVVSEVADVMMNCTAEESFVSNCSATTCEGSCHYLYDLGKDVGFWNGMYRCMSILANGTTLFLWISWMLYICLRTIAFEFTQIPTRKRWIDGGLLDVANVIDWDGYRKRFKTTCRFCCGRLDEVFDESDHTFTRKRSIRFFCCLHMLSGLLALILVFSLFYESIKNNSICIMQAVMVQFTGAQIGPYVIVIFVWYLLGECIENREVFNVKRFASDLRIQKKKPFPKEYINDPINSSEFDPKDIRIERKGKITSPFFRLCVCPLEICTYCAIFTFIILTIIIPRFSKPHEFIALDEGEDKGHW